MEKIEKPATINYPCEYSLKIHPEELVKVGTKVTIRITYELGNYNLYKPVLQLLYGPHEHLENPKEFGTVSKKGKTVIFEFVAKHTGRYTLRLLPFSDIAVGELIEITVLTAEDVRKRDTMLKKFFRSFTFIK